MDLKEQFEKETGNSAYSQGFQFKLYNEKYVEWLEEELEQSHDAGQVDEIVNRQNRFVIEPTQQDNGWTYWVWEGDSFERTLVKRCDTLEETHRWIVDELAG